MPIMVFSDLLLTFFSFWGLVHVIYRIISQKKTSHEILLSRIRRTPSGILPTTNLTPPTTKTTLSYFSIYYETTKFNAFFESLARKAPKFWKIWFNIGILVGISAMIIGMGVMAVAGWKLLMGIIGSFEFDVWNHQTNGNTLPTSSSRNNKFVKRGEEVNHHVKNNDEDHQVFVPVIPGVTLPISHLIYYFIALLICGIIHEAGHAIAAYCEHVPVHYTGVFIYLFYPGAFVNFSKDHLSRSSLTKYLRIYCAGVWHNMVIFLFGTFILNSGIGTLSMTLIGYRSVEGIGVSVIGIEGTDLVGILRPSTLITKLNDYEMDGASLEKWSDFLLQNNIITKSNYGFCASEKDIIPSLDCCDITAAHPYGNSKNREISCFQRSDQSNSHYQELNCLQTKPILVNINEQRCRRDSDCDNTSPICVLPYTPVGFPTPVRIYFKYPPWIVNQKENDEQVLLWLGDLEDLYKIIQVSILQPRWSWVPLWIPVTLELILRYTVSFSLALCILNILPAFKLDGHHVLGELLTWLYDDPLSSVTTTSRMRKRKLENVISYSTTGLVGWVVFGTLISGVFFEGH